MKLRDVAIGEGHPLALIAGLNVLETLDAAVAAARGLAALGQAHARPVVFKASFDKANRTRVDGFRGPGLEAGLAMLAAVGSETGLPVLTDVHEPGQAALVAEVADGLQIPAFLCRQTDLLRACAETGRAINLKKGQFVAPEDMRHAVDKLRHFGADDVLVTERGTSFGHHDLVVDYRGLAQMRAFAPVCFDATHSAQRPGARDGAAGGAREAVAPLARAAVAAGVDAVFIEVHDDPERAPVDGPCQITPAALDALLFELIAIEDAVRHASPSERRTST